MSKIKNLNTTVKNKRWGQFEEPSSTISPRIQIATMICQGLASSVGYAILSGDDPSQFVKDAYTITDEILRQGNPQYEVESEL